MKPRRRKKTISHYQPKTRVRAFESLSRLWVKIYGARTNQPNSGVRHGGANDGKL